jgi:hypothetical protein
MKSKDWRPTAFAETAPGVVTEEEADASRGDQRRALYEFLRHLMTLDSGALVLTVTLIEKVFAQPAQRSAVGFAVAAFLLSLLAGAITYLNLLANYPRVGAPRMSSSDLRFYLWSMAATVFGFMVGMGALAWFFWTNWFR